MSVGVVVSLDEGKKTASVKPLVDLTVGRHARASTN
jgi:hypothetical protein